MEKNTRKKTCKANNVVYNNDYNQLTSSEFRAISLVDDFFSEPTMDVIDGSIALSYADPIYILFNQERLNSLGNTAAQEVLKSFMPKSSSLQELKANASDSELLYMIKSRHLQAPSEILAWSDLMAQNMDRFNSELQQIRDSKVVVEPPKTE